MKIRTLFFTFLTLFILNYKSKAQAPTHEDSLQGFSMKEMNHHLEGFKGTLKERNALIARSQRAYIKRKYKLDEYDIPKLVRDVNARLNQNPGLQTINCTNIGFDNGTTAGWTMGGNTDASGGGTATSGDNFITSGAGTDPYGNYPVVFAGTNSLKLSNDVNTSGNYLSSATRVISVPTGGTSFFKLSFAIDILDYPHAQTDAARFEVQFFNASGTLLPCPQYECYYYQGGSTGTGISVGVSNFQQTPGTPGVNIGGQAFAVTYAPWQTVAMDLSAYGGTNVTCVVTCKWCVYNYDWAYCYIDADCPSSATPPLGTCGALPFALNGPGGMDTYSWTAPPGNNPATATTPTINASVAGTFTLNATINTCSVVAYTFTYNVSTGPTPSFTDAISAGCSGVGTFTSTSTPNGGPPISSYTWEWGDGSPNGSGANATHSFASSGTQTVTLVISNGSCVDSVSGTVVIPPHPTSSFTTVNNCFNSLSNFTSTSTSSVAIASQNWAFGDGGTASGAAQTHTYGAPGTYSVTLTITDANSCTNTSTQNITIYPLPTITANSPSICGGVQTATLTAAGASTYTWSPSAGLSSGTGTTVTGTPTVTTIYTITGTDANGCVNTGTTSISLNPNPTVTVNSPTICVGQQTATLTAAGAVSYAWSPGLSSGTGTIVTGSPAATTQYIVTGTNAGGCIGTATATVFVNPLPVINVNNASICQGQQTATLTAAGANTYSWNPSGSLSSNMGTTVTGTPTVTTIYTVIGTDANGCFNSTNSTVTVLPLTPVTVNSSTICLGQQTATLTAGNATTYSWSPSATLSGNTGTTVTGTPSVTTNYTVTGTNPNGCVSIVTTTITVNPLPIVTVNSSTICVGQQTATLTAGGANVYSWNPSATLSNNIGGTVTGTPVTTTPYTVTGTDINGCISTATSTITVNPLPLPVATSNTPCVSEQALTLNCTPNGLISYSWAGSNFFSSSVQNPTVGISNVVASTAGIYTVVVIDANACVNTATVNVSVNPLPVIAVNSPTVCQNQTINLTSNAAGGVTYSWSGPNSYGSALQNPSIVNAMPTMSGAYAVTITDANGCYNSNVAQVIVNSLPTINVNTGNICAGQEIATLTASGADTYTWTPSGSLSGSMGASVDASPSTTTNYTINATDIHGCQNYTTTVVNVNPLPVVTTSTVTPACVPLCVTFTATSNPPANSYVWSYGNGQNSTATLSPALASFTTATCYTLSGTSAVHLTVTDIHGCVSTATTMAVSYPIPVADFDYQPQPVTILAPEVQFLNQSSSGLYSWNFGDAYNSPDTSIATNPGHTYSYIGTYSVTLSVTTLNGCSATVVKPVVVNDMYAIYVPNAFSPNGDGKNEMFKAVGEGINKFKLYIFDRWGNNLFYTDDINQGWDGHYQGRGSQILQEDVYVWKIDVTDLNNQAHSLHGTVTLLK